jgi:hypothetical protein
LFAWISGITKLPNRYEGGVQPSGQFASISTFGVAMNLNRNNKGGTNTVEFGPALFVLIIMVLIPCIDFMQIGLAYACGWYANHLAVREATCTGPTYPGPTNTAAKIAADNVVQGWANSGFGKFLHSPVPVNTVVDPHYSNNGQNFYCKVTTQVTVSPMFSLPFVASAPITFQYTAVRPLEETGIN